MPPQHRRGVVNNAQQTQAHGSVVEDPLQRVEMLLKASGGAKAFDELAAQVPGLKLVDVKGAYPIVFKDGKWIVNIKQTYEESHDVEMKKTLVAYLDSFGGFRSVSRTSKFFSITRAQIRSFGLDIQKEMVLSPSYSLEASSEAEIKDPLSEEMIDRIVELLAQGGGVLAYSEVGIAVGNVTKAQLRNHFDLQQFEDGRCEVRLPGVVGTMEELRGDMEPELVSQLPADELEDITAWIEANGGSVDTEALRDKWPHVKKAQLRHFFDVEVTRKVKETGKRFYSVTLKGEEHSKKRAALLKSTDKSISKYLKEAGKGNSKGSAKGEEKGSAKDAEKAKTIRSEVKGSAKGAKNRQTGKGGKHSLQYNGPYGTFHEPHGAFHEHIDDKGFFKGGKGYGKGYGKRWSDMCQYMSNGPYGQW